MKENSPDQYAEAIQEIRRDIARLRKEIDAVQEMLATLDDLSCANQSKVDLALGRIENLDRAIR